MRYLNRLTPSRIALALSGVVFFFLAGSAHAAVSPSPGWQIDSVAAPTNFSASQNPECRTSLATVAEEFYPCDAYEVSAMNAGSEPTDGSPIVLTDALPPGVTVVAVKFYLTLNPNTIGVSGEPRVGEIGGDTVELGENNTGVNSLLCTVVPVQCTYSEALPPNAWLTMKVYVTVNEPEVAGAFLTNRAEVSGGGAAPVATGEAGQIAPQKTNEINPNPAAFGPANFDFFKDGLNGAQDSQAGGHPYELTTTIDLANVLGRTPGTNAVNTTPSVEAPKDIVVDLPLGFAGSTESAPQCTEAQLDSEAHCPPDTVVGHLTTEPPTGAAGTNVNGPIWNIAPERGHPAEFGYVDFLKGTHIAGYVSVVPTPKGYVLQFVAPEIPEVVLSRIVVTFYGDPAEEQAETEQQQTEKENGGHPVARKVPSVQVPFFINPTACSNGPQEASIWVDSWAHPASFGGADDLIPTNLNEPQWKKMTSVSPPVSGCNALQFTPQIGSQPTTNQADSPSGLEFEQRIPQNEVFATDATPALKDTTIVFPAGMTVDPSSADGLGVCSNAQIGWTGPTLFDFTQNPPDGAGGCPENSKIGVLELETPLIPGKLYGEVFLAAQDQNPFGSVFATYIVVNDPTTGVVLKLAGEVKLCASAGETIDGKTCEAPGQITSTFDETPQLPFSDLKVHFFGGPRAEFATPPNCGLYTTDSVLEPWSAPASGPNGTPFDSYLIDEDCAIGFAPAFTGGSTNLQAGAYTTFQASFERQDSDQELGGAEITLPPGLLANITSVSECGEAELKAEAEDAPTGGCPANSQVGTVSPAPVLARTRCSSPARSSGPARISGGPVRPRGCGVREPGPFHFGNVLVRQSIHINPITAAVTDVSDPFPTFIDPRGANGDVNGIPIKLRRVDVEINRPGFSFNPTNCAKEKFKVGGEITSVSGASKTLSTPFQVTNCGHLKFAPTSPSRPTGKLESRRREPDYKVGYPMARRVLLDIIRQSRTPTGTALQANHTAKSLHAGAIPSKPGGLPGTIDIGHVKAVMPRTSRCRWKARCISYRTAAKRSRPCDGACRATASRWTSSATRSSRNPGSPRPRSTRSPTTPHSFELTLPEGPYSALAANGNLCPSCCRPQRIRLPVGHRAALSTAVTVEGCKAAIYVTKHRVKGKTATIRSPCPQRASCGERQGAVQSQQEGWRGDNPHGQGVADKRRGGVPV